MINKYFIYKGVWICNNNCSTEKLSSRECKTLLDKGGYCIRHTYNFDKNIKTSFWYVIKDSFGGIEELPTKVRNMVRKSLRTYEIKKISNKADILNFGYSIFVSAQTSYKVNCDVMSHNTFINYANELINKTDIEIWSVKNIITNEVVALAINTIHNNEWCEYNTLKATNNALHDNTYPYYGLIYEMNRYYLQEKKLKYVNDGARSITNHSNIQPFLIDKFKFRKAYCDIEIIYQWWLKPIITILYPFRKLIPIAKIQNFLNMEAMARGEI